MVLARQEFVGVLRNAVSGLGFDPDIAMVDFPMALFLGESDLMSLESRVDDFVHGLTKWRTSSTRQASGRAPNIRIDGASHVEEFRKFNELFLKKRWGDGLPLVPPTRETVDWILLGTDLPADAEIGTFLPRGGIVTAEVLAVALAMSGGRPEYFPILRSAVEAIFSPVLFHAKWQASSCSAFPAVIVNGPVAKEIGLNSSFGLLGPDPGHPAGASIGRAIRLLQQNVGGALPGIGSMSMFGGMRYTNAVFAEDERGLPAHWKPFNEDCLGFEKGRNSVAVAVMSGATNIMRRGIGTETLEEEATGSLRRIASYMRSDNVNCLEAYREGVPGILIISSPIALQLSSLGWSKQAIREYLWEHSRIPLAELKSAGLVQYIERAGHGKTLQDPWPITSRPENIAIVVAGGSHTTHAYWMQSAFTPKVIGSPIKLPRRWGELIAQATKDLAMSE